VLTGSVTTTTSLNQHTPWLSFRHHWFQETLTVVQAAAAGADIPPVAQADTPVDNPVVHVTPLVDNPGGWGTLADNPAVMSTTLADNPAVMSTTLVDKPEGMRTLVDKPESPTATMAEVDTLASAPDRDKSAGPSQLSDHQPSTGPSGNIRRSSCRGLTFVHSVLGL